MRRLVNDPMQGMGYEADTKCRVNSIDQQKPHEIIKLLVCLENPKFATALAAK